MNYFSFLVGLVAIFNFNFVYADYENSIYFVQSNIKTSKKDSCILRSVSELDFKKYSEKLLIGSNGVFYDCNNENTPTVIIFFVGNKKLNIFNDLGDFLSNDVSDKIVLIDANKLSKIKSKDFIVPNNDVLIEKSFLYRNFVIETIIF
ncbi:hypothetical protein OD757_06965 [Acinetobacter sp. AYS6]|uniref:hypothetical protein n=1 Tax=Acinetobacter sp. AYS6 TaxID=2983297 RepID=UPI0021D65A40|nr:hypothetical protein [Acinetobacter sp. AYS6]MCU7696960.1 hypothetical protein [Acinetobacter sp. AYS6]